MHLSVSPVSIKIISSRQLVWLELPTVSSRFEIITSTYGREKLTSLSEAASGFCQPTVIIETPETLNVLLFLPWVAGSGKFSLATRCITLRLPVSKWRAKNKVTCRQCSVHENPLLWIAYKNTCLLKKHCHEETDHGR